MAFQNTVDRLWADLEKLPLHPHATLAIIVSAIVLLLILLCCICCRLWLRLKKEKKKKKLAKLDLRKTSLIGSSYIDRNLYGVDELDFNDDFRSLDPNEVIKIGKLKFSVEFDSEKNIVYITVLEGKNIIGGDVSGFSDPYVVIELIPASKKRYKTKVIRHNKNPVFNHKARFKRITYKALKDSCVVLRIFDSDFFTRDDSLGEVIVPVIDLDLSAPTEEWRMIREGFSHEKKTHDLPNLGHICLGLAYESKISTLAVFLLGCKDLPAMDPGGFSDPFVKFWLVQDGKKIKKRKSTVKMRTLNPMYNERFDFEVPLKLIEKTSLMFIVADYDRGEKGESIGEILVGQLASGEQLKQWKKMIKTPGTPVMVWHKLRKPTISE